MGLWAGAAGDLGLGLPLLVGARGEESCTVRVADRLDVCGGCLVPLFVETNDHLGVGGFFQVGAVGMNSLRFLMSRYSLPAKGSVSPMLG